MKFMVKSISETGKLLILSQPNQPVMLKKVLIWAGAIIVVLVLAVVIIVETTHDRNYNEDFPVEELTVEITPERVARGRYLANGPAHCSHCHVPFEKLELVESGEEVALTGGFDLEIPPGTFHAPNITPDPETGIGNRSDGELYRMLRYNINHKGKACVDFMPFVNMAEEDIYAIIAYLRQNEPVKHQRPEVELSFLGKAVYAMGAIGPGQPDEPVLKSVKPAPSREYGRYLAYAVANCRGCHTNRDMKTGEYIGEAYAGGLQFGPDSQTRGYTYYSPNLTPDPETGILSDWSEDTFVARMRSGRLHQTSPMPWGAFKQMTDDDLRAIYRFLKSLKPVKNEIPQTAMGPEMASN